MSLYGSTFFLKLIDSSTKVAAYVPRRDLSFGGKVSTSLSVRLRSLQGERSIEMPASRLQSNLHVRDVSGRALIDATSPHGQGLGV